jgi:hypothetical protein
MQSLFAVLYWLVFALACLFVFALKAVLATGSEDHWLDKVKAYFRLKPLTSIFRFCLAQVAYIYLFPNPELMGKFLKGTLIVEKLDVGPFGWAFTLGLAGDKLADVVIVVASWAGRKIASIFNGNDKSDAAGAGQ